MHSSKQDLTLDLARCRI